MFLKNTCPVDTEKVNESFHPLAVDDGVSLGIRASTSVETGTDETSNGPVQEKSVVSKTYEGSNAENNISSSEEAMTTNTVKNDINVNVSDDNNETDFTQTGDAAVDQLQEEDDDLKTVDLREPVELEMGLVEEPKASIGGRNSGSRRFGLLRRLFKGRRQHKEDTTAVEHTDVPSSTSEKLDMDTVHEDKEEQSEELEETKFEQAEVKPK